MGVSFSTKTCKGLQATYGFYRCSATANRFPSFKRRPTNTMVSFHRTVAGSRTCQTNPGRPEVFVAPFNGSGGAPARRWQVSTTGGGAPRWRQDGREIFYVTPPPDETVAAAAVSARDTAFEVGVVEPLFAVRPMRLGSVLSGLARRQAIFLQHIAGRGSHADTDNRRHQLDCWVEKVGSGLQAPDFRPGVRSLSLESLWIQRSTDADSWEAWRGSESPAWRVPRPLRRARNLP